ncbi:phosphoribosyltransferase [Allopontixanthobacter sp.]|uniref:phosphoribosyltransferase n=1 Tax=Allopontixanthobacter sp. TaxID=2906452 RepID=UPI002AB99466|nr:phosphoribosyltransferase [Allopontixanthobacter sp.]MDZ4307954.1 phosphoribosyltransferase [Allopontixanthobacter sp.]
MSELNPEDTANGSRQSLEDRRRPKVYLTIEEAVDLSCNLGKRIRNLTPRPDFAIGLANGGTLPALVAAEEAGIACEIIKVRRKGSRLKQRFDYLRVILKLFPKAMQFKPLRMLKAQFDNWFSEVECTDWAAQTGDVFGQNVVIIDDCVDSGSTAAFVRERLLADGAASVRVAVISWGTKHDSRELHSLVPDIYLNRTIDYYPWSLENPGFKKFSMWLESQGQELWK